MEEILNGGLADGYSIQDIADKHAFEVSNIQAELEVGIEVEMEHTDDRNKAEEIALDHLYEDPCYYSHLKDMESQHNDI